MDTPFLAILAVLAVVSFSGASLRFLRKRRDFSEDAMALGAGAMVAVALLHVFPETVEGLPEFGAAAFFAGFLLIYLVENVWTVHACAEHGCHYHRPSLVSWCSISLHTLFDGLAVGSAYAIDGRLGALVLTGIALHQIPVSAATYALISKGGWTKRTKAALFGAFATSAPMGAAFGALAVPALGAEGLLPWALALSGGTLLYVGASDLLPTVHRESSNRTAVMALFVLGAAAVALSGFFE